MSQYNAGFDEEEDGGVLVDGDHVENPMDDDNDEAPKVQYQALEPVKAPDQSYDPWPTPSQHEGATTVSSIASGLNGMSLDKSEPTASAEAADQ
jgi:hypothetical protein